MKFQIKTTLHNFALITYDVDPNVLSKLIHPDFEVETVTIGGRSRGLISAVPFQDVDFRLKVLPYPAFSFWQINYRAHIKNRKTGERCAWFFGTDLGSSLVKIPRDIWRLPWHSAEFGPARTYGYAYDVASNSELSKNHIELRMTYVEPELIEGFSDKADMLNMLTDPTKGYYYRRDGKLGSYDISHPKMELIEAFAVSVRIGLFHKLGLLWPGYQHPLAIWVAKPIEFTIYLPPKIVT